jgi:hypothetical protein
VRHTGLDLTVHSSDGKRSPGAPVPSRTAGAALGVVRGRPPSRPPDLPRPRPLPPR